MARVECWIVGTASPPVVAVVNGDGVSGYMLNCWELGAGGPKILSRDTPKPALRVSPDGSLGISEHPRGTFQLQQFPSLEIVASLKADRGIERRILLEGRLTNSGKVLLVLGQEPAPVFSAIWLDVATGTQTPVKIEAAAGERIELEDVVTLPQGDALQLRFHPAAPSHGPWRPEWRSATGEGIPAAPPAGTWIAEERLFRSVRIDGTQLQVSTVDPSGKTTSFVLGLPP